MPSAAHSSTIFRNSSMSMTPCRRCISSRGQNTHLALHRFVLSIWTMSGRRGARSRPVARSSRRTGLAFAVRSALGGLANVSRQATARLSPIAGSRSARAMVDHLRAGCRRAPASARTRRSASIFVRSGTRRGMSSNPASYASSYGTSTISDALPVSVLTRCARSRIEIFLGVADVEDLPDRARLGRPAAIRPSTTSPT